MTKFHVEMDIDVADDGPDESAVVESDVKELVEGAFVAWDDEAAPQYAIKVDSIRVVLE